MTQAAKSQEPSMEEILASIRRIIADDDATKSAARTAESPKPETPPAPPPPPPSSASPPPRPRMEPEPPMEVPNAFGSAAVSDQSSDILDLTEAMAAPPPPPPPMPPAPQFRTIDATPDVGFAEPSERPQGEERGHLISNATRAAVDSAFNTLAQTVLMQNARTLEDLVREMLRPMLKAWLEDNLPSMVERLVRAEIERVSRGRAG